MLALPTLVLAACATGTIDTGTIDTGTIDTGTIDDEADGTSAVADAGPGDLLEPGAAAAALALVPQDAAYLTITEWSAIKERLGAGGLTGESIQTDRIEFWRAVGASTVLLTDGSLRAENSRLGLRYGVTQDDAIWELRWARDGADDGPGGLALRLRDDLDLAGRERAVQDEVPGVEGARVLADQQLLLRGEGDPGATLAVDPAVSVAVDVDAETQVVVPGCRPWPAALGVDATVEEQEALVGGAQVQDLLDPEAWRMSFAGRSAEVGVVYPEGTTEQAAQADARVRLALAEEWPTTESVGWGDALGLPPGLTGPGVEVTPVGDRLVARADYRVVTPPAAGTIALAGLVPWAVCSEIDWLAEPTGR